ncbi:MAG: hypothetical protein K9I74_01310 [Bacteroidales bacterium]|nr:hypothetical protein [Bacteroidales bacterium]
MPLDEEKTQKVKEYLDDNAGNFSCPICDSNNWQIGDMVSPPNMNSKGQINMGGDSLPLVEVICNKCYHVEFFAAKPMGVLD